MHDEDDYIAHYASPYYDPVKAHEYYERTKKLKGRRTGTLNDKGKEAKAYVKTKINSKRDSDLKNAEIQSAKRIEERKQASKRETYDRIKKESDELGQKLDKLISAVSKLDGPALRANKKRILNVINQLASKNKQSRTALISMYKSNKTKINTEERERLTAEKKKIRTDASSSYEKELSKIQSDSNFLNVKKTTKKKSSKKKSSSSASTSKKSSTKKSSTKKSSTKKSNKEFKARMEAGHKRAAENYARIEARRAELNKQKAKK